MCGPIGYCANGVNQTKTNAVYHLNVESNEQNKQTKQKQTHGYREHFEDCQIGGALRGWSKKWKELRSTNW